MSHPRIAAASMTCRHLTATHARVTKHQRAHASTATRIQHPSIRIDRAAWSRCRMHLARRIGKCDWIAVKRGEATQAPNSDTTREGRRATANAITQLPSCCTACRWLPLASLGCVAACCPSVVVVSRGVSQGRSFADAEYQSPSPCLCCCCTVLLACAFVCALYLSLR